jgi:CheY-like chemotaxis protein
MATTTEQVEKGLQVKKAAVDQSSAKILLVDDEKPICSLYFMILEKQGFSKIKSVTDGVDAVHAFEKDPKAADLVILDYRMPVMNGTEACRRIKRINPKVKTIMVTAYNDLNEQDRALFESVLYKPISSKELCNAINEVLENSEGMFLS